MGGGAWPFHLVFFCPSRHWARFFGGGEEPRQKGQIISTQKAKAAKLKGKGKGRPKKHAKGSEWVVVGVW